MLRTLSRRVTQLQSAAARRCSDQAAKTPAAVKPSEAAEVTAHEAAPRIHTYTPNNVDRKILVHFKYYPSLAEVPDKVDQGTMSRARSQASIKIANTMILVTIVLACITIFFAKKNSRQNSMIEENQRRHLMYSKGSTSTGTGVGRLGLVTHSKDDE